VDSYVYWNIKIPKLLLNILDRGNVKCFTRYGEDKYVSMSMISNVVERLEVDSFAGSYFTHSSKIVKIVFRI